MLRIREFMVARSCSGCECVPVCVCVCLLGVVARRAQFRNRQWWLLQLSKRRVRFALAWWWPIAAARASSGSSGTRVVEHAGVRERSRTPESFGVRVYVCASTCVLVLCSFFVAQMVDRWRRGEQRRL